MAQRKDPTLESAGLGVMATDGPAQGSNKNQLASARWQRLAQRKDPTPESAGLGAMATDGPTQGSNKNQLALA